jgi:hypothetical protein
MGSISTMVKENVSVLNLDKLLVSTTLILTPNMQIILMSITLQGQKKCKNNFFKKNFQLIIVFHLL